MEHNQLNQNEAKLQLNEFKVLYRYYRRYIKWFDFLLLGVLVWIESKLIISRSVNTVDEAIKDYETLHEPPLPDMVTPVYTETTVETSTSLSEMRLTAPWYIDQVSERSEPPGGL